MADNTFFTEITAAGVATLTLNRFELHNAFDDRLIAALTLELQELQADPTVRVVVLAAARAFRRAPTSTGCAAWPAIPGRKI